jgi:DNA-binding Lrp family transcriptional regulator
LSEQLDAVDRTILNMLQNDARVSFSKIAETIGVSEATVRYRVKQLEKSRVIKTYTTLLTPTKVGYSTTGIMMVKIDSEKFESQRSKSVNYPRPIMFFRAQANTILCLLFIHAIWSTSPSCVKEFNPSPAYVTLRCLRLHAS